MALYLEIVEGPNRGSQHRLKRGFKIGRTQGEIQIPDPKISSIHAEIRQSNDGSLAIHDLQSSNGIRLNGRKVACLNLVPGSVFSIGKTVVLVVEKAPSGAPKVIENTVQKTWVEDLKVLLKKSKIRNEESKDRVHAFNPPLVVQFVMGPQADQKMMLGFGPRRFGFGSMDCELLDPNAPVESFEIVPTDTGAMIKAHDNAVLLNEKSFQQEYLRPGDEIKIGQTVIRILEHK